MTGGLTLVELLVVIAIMGILLQLLLPAIQAAREAARRSTCANHLRQLATGSWLHQAALGYLPSGGWSGDFVGDPNRGYGREQPGSWLFSILAYIEESNARDGARGVDLSAPQLSTNAQLLYTTCPVVFHCPSRRSAKLYPFVRSGSHAWTSKNAKGVLALGSTTKSDFAANSGDSIHSAANTVGNNMWTPESYGALATQPQLWSDTASVTSKFFQTGVMFYRSEIRPAQIMDGLSSTYLIGEKFVDPVGYEDINDVEGAGVMGDNESAWVGYEWDNHRVAWQPGSLSSTYDFQPQQDQPGINGPAKWAFGSSHAGALNMSYCDGSVRPVSYDIDHELHRRMANRLDGESVSR